MGFMSDWEDRRDAERQTDANKKVAKVKAEEFKQQVVARYSQYGEVIELQDGEKLLGKYYTIVIAAVRD